MSGGTWGPRPREMEEGRPGTEGHGSEIQEGGKDGEQLGDLLSWLHLEHSLCPWKCCSTSLFHFWYLALGWVSD